MKTKMKILFAIGIITFATSALAYQIHDDERIPPQMAGGGFNQYADRERELPPPSTPTTSTTDTTTQQPPPQAAEEEVSANGSPTPKNNREYAARSQSAMRGRGRTPDKCLTIFEMKENSVLAFQSQAANPPPAQGQANPNAIQENPTNWTNAHRQKCESLDRIAGGRLASDNEQVQSLDGVIKCKKLATYTIDFDACQNATRMYDGVKVAEKAMDMQQALRTDAKNKNIQAETAKRAAEGDLQAGALDAGIAQHRHMKAMNTEKMLAYSASVAALVNALRQFPGKKSAIQKCGSTEICNAVVEEFDDEILANQSAKPALVTAIAEFTAKGLAAGIAMGNNQKAADTIAKAKQPFEDEPQDLMLERCQFNPADPACITAGERVSGGGIARGEFGFGDGGNNAFNLNPESGEFGEVGAETSLDDGNEISSLNNPFSDDAKRANDILNPAAAAQVQATGGAAGGGGGGVGGGLGGGGASLGSDLAGADKDGDKEAQIKTGKVSGIYGAVGGGGYRGIARSKENANPFASLFDKKGAGGGTEIEGSVPDIDGKASGLFQKISKRYTRIHADKRIEARNLE